MEVTRLRLKFAHLNFALDRQTGARLGTVDGALAESVGRGGVQGTHVPTGEVVGRRVGRRRRLLWRRLAHVAETGSEETIDTTLHHKLVPKSGGVGQN